MESEQKNSEPQRVESKPESYEQPVVVASYSVDELREAAAVSTSSTPG
jgi:hypothetical protein